MVFKIAKKEMTDMATPQLIYQTANAMGGDFYGGLPRTIQELSR
jgi:hypothetical protein